MLGSGQLTWQQRLKLIKAAREKLNRAEQRRQGKTKVKR